MFRGRRAGRWAAIPVAVMACAGLLATQATAASAATPGIDTSYGKGGVASLSTQIPAGFAWQGFSENTALAGAKGSAIVVSDLSTCPTPGQYQCQDMVARRFTPSGSLDGTYGQGGALSLGEPLAWESLSVTSFAATDARGRLWVARNQAGSLRIARYTSRGVIDAGFGSDGTVLVEGVGADARPEAILAAPHERTLVALSEAGRVTLLRLLPSGRLDRSFGKGGEVVVGIASAFENKVYETTKGATLIVAGRRLSDSGSFTPVQRVSPKGKVDVRFNRLERRAQVKALAAYAEPMVRALVPRSDGTIELLGTSRSEASTGPSFSLRLDASGETDKAYGKNGLMGLGDGLVSAVPGSGGSTLVMYEAFAEGRRYGGAHLRVERLLPDGHIDLRFGGPTGIQLPIEGGEGELVASSPGRALAYVGGAEECRQRCESAPYLSRLIEPSGSTGGNKGGRR